MLKDSLKKYFGFTEFRPGQEEIIQSILEKKNVLAIMPTGAGKSLCYQLPSLLSETYSIIISPLISLMQDQVHAINQDKYSAAFINSSLDYLGTEKVLNDLTNNKLKMLFIAPEKLNNPHFVERIKSTNPEYLFVDEAHCISEWGHNFRPSFRYIKDFANSIGVKSISGFTATATPAVRNDIITQLGFKEPSVFVYGFERENISLNVEQTKNRKERILKLLKENKIPTIIYASTRKSCETLTEYLRLEKINVEFYHAGLSNEIRKVIQDDFIKNELNVIVATNAFGMGIDKQNIGMVIHFNIPGSIENLYQEFGRAGRDGNQASAYLFFSEKDKYIQEFLIKMNHPSIEQIKMCYDALLDYHQIAVNSFSENSFEIDAGLLRLLDSKSINQNILNSAINSLEQSGYLTLNSRSQLIRYFKFLINDQKLKSYVKKLKNHELQEVIITLLKIYGSAPFNNKVEIDINQIVKMLDSTRKNIEYHLSSLDRIGIIKFEQPNFFQSFKMLQERIESKNLRLNYGEINSKIKIAKQKLDSVLEYCFTNECRFKFILNYFGEDVTNYKCNKCDNCLGKKTEDYTANEYLSEIIIRTFKEFTGGLTIQRLIGILTGKSKSLTAKNISTFQSCSHFSNDQIEASLKLLLFKKIVKEVNGIIFIDSIVELNTSEDNFLEEQNNYESNLELFNKLREERNIAAKKFSQNPDIICSDTILRCIATEKPRTTTELLKIDGFNQRMYNKLGLEILECIHEFSLETKSKNNMHNLPKHITHTFKLVQKGYSLTEISNLLKLPESIVSLQIESIISYNPKADYNKIIPKVEFEEISSKISDLNEDIKELKKILPSKISYAKIRIVKAIISASRKI